MESYFVWLVYTCDVYYLFFFFFCKQKTAYEMCISDWSSDVCSSDLMSICWDRTNSKPSCSSARCAPVRDCGPTTNGPTVTRCSRMIPTPTIWTTSTRIEYLRPNG